VGVFAVVVPEEKVRKIKPVQGKGVACKNFEGPKIGV
jgi:hypothetical protein